MFRDFKLYFPEYLGGVHLPGLVPYVALVGILVFILAIVPGLIWIERVVIAFMQDRSGPNRVGPRGLLQTLADGVKLFFKEEIRPRSVDVRIYYLAPVIAMIPALAAGAVLPLQEITFLQGAHGTSLEGWTGRLFSVPFTVGDVNIGLLYILALSSLQVYGVVLAGWSSNNKYSLLGGLRASAQLISYELAMGLALLCVILLAGSLKLNDIVAAQSGFPLGMQTGPEILRGGIFSWYWLGTGLVPVLLYTIAMIAETNRAPFDLPEAESELIAGFHTEYTSMKFAMFFMGEYASMLTVCGLNAAMFWGGPLPPLNIAPLTLIPGFIWFILKIMVGIFFYVWLRATLPRLRYDALMNLGWKRMLPLGLIWLFVLAGYSLVREPNETPETASEASSVLPISAFPGMNVRQRANSYTLPPPSATSSSAPSAPSTPATAPAPTPGNTQTAAPPTTGSTPNTNSPETTGPGTPPGTQPGAGANSGGTPMAAPSTALPPGTGPNTAAPARRAFQGAADTSEGGTRVILPSPDQPQEGASPSGTPQ